MVNKWETSKFVLDRLVPTVGVEPYPLDELMLMVWAVKITKPEFIFDWGTHIGKSARIFYETIKYLSLQSIVHSIDLPDEIFHPEHPGHKRGQFVRNLNGVMLHQGDGLKVSLKVLDKVKKNSRVLFFVDGDHQYRSIMRELKGIVKYSSKSAILIHDTFNNNDPYKAVQNFLKIYPKSFSVYKADFDLPGMTFLYPVKMKR